jgi:type IV secretory pathway TrbD component
MELHEALSQISQIRRQMARTAVFRGYRSATAAFSGVVAIAAGVTQSVWFPEPSKYMKGYLVIWLVAALLRVAVAAMEMVLRCVKSRSPLQKELSVQAAEQFVPCLVAGALLTLVLDWFNRDLMWLLPGLWAILFSLGIFASRRVLPGAISIVAGYYLLAGLVCIAVTNPISAVSPWTMPLMFAPGQFLAAFVLWWTLEKDHGRP